MQPAGRKAVATERSQLGDHLRIIDRHVGKRTLAHELGPPDERRAGANRTIDRARLVGEDRDVLRHRIELQQRRLVAPPDAARAGRVRVDERDLQRRCELLEPGEQALEQHDRARARSDEDDSPSTGIRHGHPPTATGAPARTGGRPSRSRSVAPSS